MRKFSIEWNELSEEERVGLTVADYRVGLPETTEYQRTDEFRALPREEQQWAYQEQWIILTGKYDTKDLRTHQIRMPTDAVFERVLADEIFGHLGVTYVDVGTGLRWSSPLKETMNWHDANQACRALGPGSRLPTKEEYEDLVNKLGKDNENKLNALLPKHPVEDYYWSSSVLSGPGYSNVAYVLSGVIGDFDYYDHRNNLSGSDYHAVRCVRSSR